MIYDTGILSGLANLLGAPEPALRLLLSLFLGYPLAAIYHKYITNTSELVTQCYFAITGILIGLFNYGTDTYHSATAILITYLLCCMLRKTKYFVVINFAFNMGYLLVGYFFTESNDYDIKWTMPHCVLALRLIGFGFDIADGQQPIEKLSKDQKETALNEMPSLLQLSAFAYFPASFLVGPQFSYRRYMRFIKKEFVQYNGCIQAGLKRGSFGLFYLIIRQIGSMMIPDEYLLSNEFANLSLNWKILNIGLWGKISLYKYISCWLITEGALICFGLTYNGKDENGDDDWSGCSNVKLKVFELATKMEHYVHSFNVNTNQWLSQYVYKRLKFLNNRTISYGSALLFLAVWHGFHSGYYMSFFLEYLVVTFEKQFFGIFNQIFILKYPNMYNSTVGHIITFMIMKTYNIICLGWCLVPFVYLNYTKWLTIYSALYFYGYIALILWFVGFFAYKRFGKKKLH